MEDLNIFYYCVLNPVHWLWLKSSVRLPGRFPIAGERLEQEVELS